MKKLIIILIIVIAILALLWLLGLGALKEERRAMSESATPAISETEAVESYLRANIATLSPTAPVLGGNWYVVSVNVDAENNSGQVVYEDGHIQESRGFTYTLGANGEVTGLDIK